MNEPEEVKKPTHVSLPTDHVLDLDKLDAATQLGKVVSESLPSFNFVEEVKKAADQISLSMKSLPTMPDFTTGVSVKAFVPPVNPAYETNHLLRELSSKLDGMNERNAKLVAPHFYPDSSEIIFANRRIQIPRNTNQGQLCSTLFSEPEKEWDWSEMLEAWGYDEASYGKDDWRKVYNTAREINIKVAIETGVKDLLSVTKMTVRINPEYLGQLS